MLRTASEMNTETKEAIEDFVMQKINVAAVNKDYTATFSLKDIPEWLCTKLVNYGYILIVDDDCMTVSWEQLRDVE